MLHVINILVMYSYLWQTQSVLISSLSLAVSLSRQEDRQLAAGLLACANQLHLPVVPGHHMGGAKADGEEAASQP